MGNNFIIESLDDDTNPIQMHLNTNNQFYYD